MASKIDKIKEMFKKKENTGSQSNGSFYPFWSMQVGEQAVVRFIPDKNEENPFTFFIERMTHRLEINGEKKTVPCLKMYGEKCPICDVSAAYYKQGDKDNGRKYWREKQYLAQVLVVKDPLPADKETGVNFEGQIKTVALGSKIYDAIKDAFESGDLDEMPCEYYGGTNFIIKKTQNGDYAAYDRSRFDRKQTDLDDDTIEFIEEARLDLSSLLPTKPEIEKVEAMLEAAISGSDYDDNSDDDDDTPVTKPKQVSAPKKEVLNEDEDDEDDEDAARILADIRAKRQNKG